MVNSILSSAGVVAGTFGDAVILGNAFGEEGLSILAVALPVYMIYNLIGFAFGVGGSLRVSESIGAEDKKGASVYFTQTVLFSLVVSAAVTVLGAIFLPGIIRLVGGSALAGAETYLRPVILTAPVFIMAPVLSLLIRSDADPSLSTLGITASVIVNLGLDLVFIFILKMGLFGVALAMVLGQLSAVLVYLPHFFKKHNRLKLCRVPFHPKEAAGIFRGGFGIASSYVYQGITLIVVNNILTAAGGGLAVYNILFNVSMFAYAVFDGISLALSPLVGTFTGEKDTEGVYSTMRLSLKTSFILGAVCALVLLLLAEPVAAMFGVKEDLPLVVLTIRLFALSVVQSCFNFVMASFYQAINRHVFSGMIFLLRGCALVIAFSALFIPAFGVSGAALAVLAAESVTMAILLTAAAVIRKKGGYRNLLLMKEPVIKKEFLYEKTLSPDLSRLQDSVGEIEEFCERLGIDKSSAYYINLTIEELSTNIIQFGFNDGRQHYISIKIALFNKDIYIRLRDDATSYNPFEEPDKPDTEMDYLGVSIVRAKAKTFTYNRTLVFNNLLIIL